MIRLVRRTRACLAAATVLTGALLISPALQSTASADTTVCGARSGSSPVKVTHVVWVVFENKTSNEVLSTKSPDPYLRGLVAQCGLATNYQSTPHNASKMAMTSGSEQDVYGDAGEAAGPDIYSQLGTSWLQYMGGMPGNCSTANTKTYYRRHNVAVYYQDNTSACSTQDRPLPSNPSSIDISQPFTYIEANVPQSMHGCSAGCGKNQNARLRLGDTWASSVIPALTSTASYQNGSTVIFVVWDQGWAGDNKTPLIVLSPYVTAGTTDATAYTHYSLLKGTEQYLGLSLLGNAGDSSTNSVAGHFGLPGPDVTKRAS